MRDLEFPDPGFQMDPIRVKRRTQGAAGVTGRRRHQDALETRFGEDAGIGDAIERHAAAKTEVRQAGLPMQSSRDVDQYLFDDELHARGTVGEAPAIRSGQIDRLVGLAGRTEQVDETR